MLYVSPDSPTPTGAIIGMKPLLGQRIDYIRVDMCNFTHQARIDYLRGLILILVMKDMKFFGTNKPSVLTCSTPQPYPPAD